MNRYRKIGLLLFVVLLVIAAGSILTNKLSGSTFESLDVTDQQMLEELANIYKTFEENSDKLWTEDYRIDEWPFILIRSSKDKGLIPKYAYIINTENMNNSIFSKEIELPNSMQLPKIHRVSPINFKVVSWVPWNFGTRRINDSEIFYYKYHPKMLTDPDLYFDFSSFLLHESFHTYKQKAWTYDHEGAEIIDPYPVNKENYALMGLEFTLLDEAMSENDYKAVQQLLFNWTIVRNYRYHKWPQLVGETKVEAIEGTARYIEYQYSKLTGGNLTVLATKQEPYHVTFMDVFDFIANGDAESPGYLERPIRYETGSALGLLMDKAKITWKEEMEDKASNPGMTQYEILKAYFNEKDMASADEKLKEILDSYDYDYLKTQGEKIAKLEQ